ncbi:hypothetical protein [Streptomyces sp. NBC_01187]|uniref:hypothetical protein n=1 Tax=Streptomyces sp. NBC_01187 TaxID=2903766 RepID=UPI003867390E|nr:hypothetical protein OG220_06655 [Streptomyces sp. NBC_01187]
MNTAVKIAAFGTALAATFGTAYGAGKGLGPLGTDAEPESVARHGAHGEESGGAGGDGGGSHGGKGAGAHGGHGPDGNAEAAGAARPGGLALTERGYALELKTPRVQAGKKEELRFTVRDTEGKKVTAYKKEHDKELHLIVASRDLSTFRHLHPKRSADGTWSTAVNLPRAGGYRLFADFTPDAKEAKGRTLGADLAVAGRYHPESLPVPARTATVDGYEARLDGGLEPGKARELKLKVSKGGKPVTDLQPYLAAYGHLVALRSGDLGYLHVHPNGEPGDGLTRPGPEISFTTTAPSAGAYRLFLDFKHDGKVRTAAFTVHAGGKGDAAAKGDAAEGKGDGGGEEGAGGHEDVGGAGAHRH